MWRSKYTLYIILASALLLALSSCHPKKHAVKEGEAAATQLTKEQRKVSTIVTQVNANRQDVIGIRAKMSLHLTLGSKSATVGGSLKMKRDEIIQLSLTALGLLEVGRMELTPEYLFIQDRMHKQYMQVAWKDVEIFRQADVDFGIFQALFWNELFTPGKSGTPAESDFTLSTKEGRVQLDTDSRRTLTAQFLVDVTRYLVSQATVGTPTRSDLGFDCQYKNWAKLGDKVFPNELELNVRAGSRKINADISLSRLQVDEQMTDLATTPGSSYKQVSMDDILKMLSNLNK